jgi:hypothetical protein
VVERDAVGEFDCEGFHYVCALEAEDDGRYLLLDRIDGSSTQTLLDVFYSDETKKMVLTADNEDVPLPLEVVEWFIGEARRRLSPASAAGLPAGPVGSK